MLDLMDGRKRKIEGPGRPTVIIVDREALYRWFVTEALDSRGMHVVQFRSMADAAGYLDRHRASDLLLPLPYLRAAALRST